MRRAYDDSYEPHRRLLKVLADRPDRWMYSDELARVLELSGGSKSLAGMLGAFGRRAKHRYSGLTP